jgi:3-hydroxyisobutyrate dehydrogenase-like beta-hydroxyacid dehydrogenase
MWLIFRVLPGRSVPDGNVSSQVAADTTGGDAPRTVSYFYDNYDRSFVSELVYGGEVLTGRHGTGFKLGLMAKDVRIAASAAADQSRAHQAWADGDLRRG